MTLYNTKIIETKSALEVWHYQIPNKTGYSDVTRKDVRKRSFDELSASEKVESIKRREKYYIDKKREVRRLVDCNLDRASSFLTLTQRADSPIQDSIDVGNKEFEKFIKRLKRYLSKHYPSYPLKYIATWERTEEGKVHYHIILFSFPFVPAKEMEKLWSHGFIKINKIDHVDRDKVGVYISKYFTKELEFKDAKKKAYFKSQNLKTPNEYKFYIPKNFDVSHFGSPSYEKEYELKKWRPDGFITSTAKYYFIPKDSENESINKNSSPDG